MRSIRAAIRHSAGDGCLRIMAAGLDGASGNWRHPTSREYPFAKSSLCRIVPRRRPAIGLSGRAAPAMLTAMDGARLRWLAWAAVALLFVLLLCHQWFAPDIWYHLYLGGRILETHRAQPSDHLILQQPGFVNFYWLFQLAVRGVYGIGGIPAVCALFIAAWAAALGCSAATAGAWRAGGWGALAALVAVLLCQTRFEERPEVFSYALMALEVYWLATWKFEKGLPAWKWAAFFAVQALWSNFHGYFIFGPALVALRCAASLLEGAGRRGAAEGQIVRPQLPVLGWLFGLALIATATTPLGLDNWRGVAAQASFLRQMHYAVQELLPPARVPGHLWTIIFFEGCWVALAATVLYVAGTAGRTEAFALILAGAGLFLSAISYRNIPLIVFLGAPLAGVALGRRREPGGGIPGRRAAMAAALGALGLSAWVASGGFYRPLGGVPGFGIGESRWGCPVEFAGYLRASAFSGAIFNNPGDGGYLEFHFPELRLYADTRLVDARPVREYFAALRFPERLRALRERQGFDAALLKVTESPAVVAALLREPGWKLAYADLHRAFLVDLRSPAGARAGVREPAFYNGEDLTVPVNGASAAEWVAVLAAAGDREGLLRALDQFSRAPAVPAGVLRFALQFGRATADSRVMAAAARLRTKVIPGPGAEDGLDDPAGR